MAELQGTLKKWIREDILEFEPEKPEIFEKRAEQQMKIDSNIMKEGKKEENKLQG